MVLYELTEKKTRLVCFLVYAPVLHILFDQKFKI